MEQESNYVLTPGELLVLRYFIDEESNCIIRDTHFFSYPGQIETDLKDVTRPTAGKACKLLVQIGIFDSKEDYLKHLKGGKKGGKTEFYSLKNDSCAIINIIKIIIKSYPLNQVIELLGKPYFTHNINSRFVKTVLYEREVKIFRLMYLSGWNEHEATRIMKAHKKAPNQIKNQEYDFKDYMNDVLYTFEENNSRREEQGIIAIKTELSSFFNKEKDFERTRDYYLDDYLLSSVLWNKERYVSDGRDIFNAALDLDFSIPLLLPVFRDGTPIDEKVKGILNANEYLCIKDYSVLSIQKENLKQFFKNNFSAFKEHYERYEFEKLVLPILALIWSSPMALYEFACGDWYKSDLRIISRSCNGNELLTRLVQVAINDIIKNGRMPENRIVQSISSQLKPINRTMVTEDYNITPLDNDYHKLHYRYNERYWNKISYSGANFLSPSTLRVRFKHLYDVFFGVGFVIDSTPKINSAISLQVSIDINQVAAQSMLFVYNIKNPQDLIRKLQQRKDPLYSHIRSRLTVRMQNLLLYYNAEKAPSLTFLQMIVNELNLAIMDGLFYDKKAFAPLKDKHEKIKEVMEYLEKNICDKHQIIDGIEYREISSEASIFWHNRYILEKAFEQEICQEHSSRIEGWYEKYLRDSLC